MKHIYVKVHLDFSEGGEPESNEQWCSYTDEFKSYTCGPASFKKDVISAWTAVHAEYFGEEKSTAYAVVVTYSTGDTFSYTSGEVAIPEVHESLDSAQAVVQTIREGTYERTNGKEGYTYKPWEGYFETLQSVAVVEMDVLT